MRHLQVLWVLLWIYLLAAIGCVNSGTASLPEGTATLRIAGLVLGMADHEGTREAAHDDDHDDDHESAEPMANLPLALIVGSVGKHREVRTGADGSFRFDLPAGTYHLGLPLPANLMDTSSPRTDFLIRIELSDEPVGVLLLLEPHGDEGMWNIHATLFDDENESGRLDEGEAVLEEIEAEVPFGSRRDLVLNPGEEPGPPSGGPHHGHGNTH